MLCIYITLDQENCVLLKKCQTLAVVVCFCTEFVTKETFSQSSTEGGDVSALP